jgi:membrane associated rhomboid family serine protease
MYIISLSFGIDESSLIVLAPSQRTLQRLGAYNYYTLKNGQVWRLITGALLHEGLYQISVNTISILFVVPQL